MVKRVSGNYLRTYRKRSGISQQEIARLLGYKDQWQVSRHERSRTSPKLFIALAYTKIFRVSVSVLFTALDGLADQMVEENLAVFERDLRSRKPAGRPSMAHKRKIKWLDDRKQSKETAHLS
jgi:DNA-binding XRE family transcriptional regulator